MWIMDPNLDDSVPFAIEKIAAATKRIYNRECFDEEGLVWHAGEKRTRKYESSDEESESSEESSGGESAGVQESHLMMTATRKQRNGGERSGRR